VGRARVVDDVQLGGGRRDTRGVQHLSLDEAVPDVADIRASGVAHVKF
jgi:hypothetical protein